MNYLTGYGKYLFLYKTFPVINIKNLVIIRLYFDTNHGNIYKIDSVVKHNVQLFWNFNLAGLIHPVEK